MNLATTIKPSPTCFICSAAQEITFQGVQDLEYQTYRPVDFAVCPKCRLVSQHPLPPAELLPIFYPGEYRNYQPLEETFFSALKKFQFQGLVQKITRHFGQGKQLKILEIGFGNGQLLLALKANGYSNLYGIDFSDRYFSSLKSAGIRVQTQNLEKDFPFSEHFDVIFMVNVVEHFLDPEGVLKNCRDHLTQTGKVILITPNTNALEFS